MVSHRKIHRERKENTIYTLAKSDHTLINNIVFETSSNVFVNEDPKPAVERRNKTNCGRHVNEQLVRTQVKWNSFRATLCMFALSEESPT